MVDNILKFAKTKREIVKAYNDMIDALERLDDLVTDDIMDWAVENYDDDDVADKITDIYSDLEEYVYMFNWTEPCDCETDDECECDDEDDEDEEEEAGESKK